MKVHELMEVLADSDPDDHISVVVDLGSPDSISFHPIREVHVENGFGVEIVVYEATDLFDSPPWLAAALLGVGDAS